jgi:cupin 2 domain-containing protein
MSIARGNVLADLPPAPTPGEMFDLLLQTSDVKIERIVSWGHATPTGEWLDQQADEWVLLVSGGAKLRIEGKSELLEIRPGDYLFLPARLRHRVEWTEPTTPTVWLAVHINRAEAEPDAGI